MSEPMERLFFKEKPVLAILALNGMENAYAARVAKQIDSTVPHTSSILSVFEIHGLIKSKPFGRTRNIELTEQGKKVALLLKDLCTLLETPDADYKKLERLKEMAASYKGTNKEFAIGPLRRDIAKLKGKGDENFEKAILDFDSEIVAALNR